MEKKKQFLLLLLWQFINTSRVFGISSILQPCEFNGMYYPNGGKLPGCLDVYCGSFGTWVENGKIDAACKKCYAEGDPHFKTFDGYKYDYQATGTYAITQHGKSMHPPYGIFSHFFNCVKGVDVTCVGNSTYMNSPDTVIEMGIGGSDLYTLHVNGVPYVVEDERPHIVMERTKPHPVFAWRYTYNNNDKCIRLLGSSQLAVQICPLTVFIWMPTTFHGDLYGLCGYFDGDVNNDFTTRHGKVTALKNHPNEFADSWGTYDCCGHADSRKKREIDVEENGACSLDNTTMDELQARCNEINVIAGDNIPQTELADMIDNCMYDLCAVSKSTSGDQKALDAWMGNIRLFAGRRVDINNKTTDFSAQRHQHAG